MKRVSIAKHGLVKPHLFRPHLFQHGLVQHGFSVVVSPIALVLLLASVLLGSALSTSVLLAQDPAAARLLSEAERLERSGDPAAALRELALLTRQFPSDPSAPQAYLKTARLHRLLGARDDAEQALEELISSHPRSPEAAAGIVLQGRLGLDAAGGTDDLIAAQNLFRRVSLLFGREAYPNLPARRAARIASGEIALRTGESAAAAAELLAALEDEPPAVDSGRAQLGLARAWIASGEWTAAAALLEDLAGAGDQVSDGTTRARARRLLALLHRRVLRPLAGQQPWVTSGRFPPAGLDLREAAGVAASEDGRLLVIDNKLPLVALVEANGRGVERVTLESSGRPGFVPSGGSRGGNSVGNQPFVLTAGGLTRPFDGTGQTWSEPGRDTPIKNPQAAVAGAFGDWFVAAKGLRGVLHAAGSRSREVLGSERPEVADLARDATGSIYVLDGRGQRVLRMSRDGTGHHTALAGVDWKRPTALDVDPLGNIYVLDRGHRRLDLYAPDGRLVARIGPTLGGGIELRNPVDVAVDGSGRVFIADSKLPFIVMLD